MVGCAVADLWMFLSVRQRSLLFVLWLMVSRYLCQSSRFCLVIAAVIFRLRVFIVEMSISEG